MKTTDSTQAIAWKEKEVTEARQEIGVVSFLDTLLMLPAGIIGLIIGAFPISLPLLYLITLWIIE